MRAHSWSNGSRRGSGRSSSGAHPHRLRALAWLVAVAVGLLLQSSHAAARRGRVLLIGVPEASGGWPAAERRASAELRALGFEVARASSTTPDRALTQAELIPMVQRSRAVAAVRFMRPGPRTASSAAPVAVYVVDRATGKYDVRQVSPDRIDQTLSAEQAALLAAELVYSTLVAVQSRVPTPAPSETPPPPQPAEPPPPTAPRWALRGAPLLGGSPGGTSAHGGLLLGGSWLFGRHTGVELELDAPLVPGRVTGSGGTARVYIFTQRAHLRLLAWPGDATSVGMAVGGGVLTTWSRGEADPPLTDTADTATVGLLSAVATWDAQLSRSLRLSLAFRGGLAIPEVRIRFAGEAVGRIGRPLLDGSIGIEWLW